MTEVLTWFGILLCLSQSALFSGLNLAIFSLNRLHLEVEVASGNQAAQAVLDLRRDSNFILTTILWGNVGINVLLTLLSDSVMVGVTAFVFSTLVITVFGEILPQAYGTRNALKLATWLAPFFRIYLVLLYPVAKPSGMLLDRLLGREGISYYREKHLKEILRRHMLSKDTDVNVVEATGALNFLTLDDIPVHMEGVPLHPESIIRIDFDNDQPRFPEFSASIDDDFLKRIEASGRSWVVFVDQARQPCLMLDADGFLRHALFHRQDSNILAFCHVPIVVTDRHQSIGEVMKQWRFDPLHQQDQIISQDVILLWDERPRVLTGSDLFGNLMSGIVRGREPLKAAGETAAG